MSNIRGKGISTAHIMQTIASAIINPGKWFHYSDHASHYAPEATFHHMGTFAKLIELLDLKDMDLIYNYSDDVIKIRSNWKGIALDE